MINKNLTKALSICTCSILLHACSSGSDSSSTELNDNNTSSPVVDASHLPKVSTKSFSSTPINEENAETLVKSIHKFNRYWLKEMKNELESQDLEKGETLTSVSVTENEANLDEQCTRGGNYRISLDGSIQFLADDGYRAYAPGNTLNILFANCGASFLRAGYYISGTSSSEIISGGYDGFDFLLEGTSMRTVTEHKVIHDYLSLVDDESDYYEYLHGDRLLTLINATTLRSSGDFLTEKPISFELSNPYQLHEYDFTLTQIPGRYSWDSNFELQTNKAIELDLNHLDGRYEIQYTEKLTYVDYDDDFHSGVMTVSGLNSALQIAYEETYLTYRIDEDLDGIYEVESILLYNEL